MSALIEVQEELIPLQDALAQINALPFPAVAENDIAWHAGYKFIYINGTWQLME